ncbi:hypothetical protein [Sphingosinicella rhizophila]|uniref:Uncharacterized protein n=1 Tax=Sphingosinicella rhizophila TaxID=3050082 RepID=A0ABU3QCE0_9SPHN|nr:hypothetical protein [Sphingosinicella sp. GR2756]MDT9601002.1 hypothetical protein [Sphingosinicella sp. GR2756]
MTGSARGWARDSQRGNGERLTGDGGSERDEPAAMDPHGDEVHGRIMTGDLAGRAGRPDDRISGSLSVVEEAGHPLPESDEARHEEIPGDLERKKGRGEDGKAKIQATPEAVLPDGTPYPGATSRRSSTP